MNVVLPRPTFCRTLVWVRERPMFQVSSDTELRVSQEFFQPFLLANQPNLALQGSSKGSSFPSTLFLDRLFPENLVCQCDSLSNLAFSASASLGTQARSRKGPFTSWHRPHLLMEEKTCDLHLRVHFFTLKKGCWLVEIRNLSTSILSSFFHILIWWYLSFLGSSLCGFIFQIFFFLVLLEIEFEIVFYSLMVLKFLRRNITQVF